MKRFHVHVAVDDLAQSIRFYSTLFAAEPNVVKADYAKWMLEDPRVNFAVSTAGNDTGRLDTEQASRTGISHLGIQAENETELAEIYDRLGRAERPVIEETGAVCCYARSDKQWIADPSGVAWETFFTHEEVTVYGASRAIDELGKASGGLASCTCGPAAVTDDTAAAKPSACCA